MAPPEDPKRRVARKLTKKRKEDVKAYTMELPEGLRNGDDVDEDCTAPKVPGMIVNQSVFGMIAAAGSQVDFNQRFEDSDDDEEADTIGVDGDRESTDSPATSASRLPTDKKRGHKLKLSDSKLLRSLSHLGSHRKHKTAKISSPLSESPTEDKENIEQTDEEDMADKDTTKTLSSRGPPVMAQMLDARQVAESRPSFDMRRSMDKLLDSPRSSIDEAPATTLSKKLAEIFGFDRPEAVIEEYPCWLMKSVLLQGYMYITEKHVCFYAYLPKRSHTIVKSGHLNKRGLRNPKYRRYWFSLKGDVLSYYDSPDDKYFVAGNIDLRYGISASVADKEKGKDGIHFEVVTADRTYHFKADSVPSAKEWVKAVQKIIFRSHNDGDSVKISLPIENVLDVEDSQVVEFAETCKIRVIDNDETFAIDEYYFSFFSFGKEALSVLQLLAADSAANKISEDTLQQLQASSNGPADAPSSSKSLSNVRESKATLIPPDRPLTPGLKEVKATLSPIMSPISGRSPRASGEYTRPSFDFQRSQSQIGSPRRSIDLSRLKLDGSGPSRSTSTGRRSFSQNRDPHKKKNSDPQDSSDSYVHSMEQRSAQSVSEDTQGSASHILRTSDGFFQPSMNRSASASRHRDETPMVTSHFLERPKKQPQHANTIDVTEQEMENAADNGPTPSLQNLVKAGAYPLQRAAGFANYLNRHSKRMSTLLATESMGYVEKVHGMWQGNSKHYDEPEELRTDEHTDDELGGQSDGAEERFQKHFALPAGEKLQASFYAYLHRVLPLYGKIYISNRFFCFRSLLLGTRTKIILPLKDIENIDKEKGFRFGYSGLVITIRGHEELFFEFATADSRDDCCVTLLQDLEAIHYLKESGMLTREEEESAAAAMREHRALQAARNQQGADHDLELPKSPDKIVPDAPPILFDDPAASILHFKPKQPLRITCLTIGSRGDVQPYIALCKGLKADGHIVKIATHEEFRGWVEGHGILFAPVAGDPTELMRICVENGMFTVSFLREASSTFRGWIDDLLSSAWKACQDTDVLIESPSAMAGIHIAEALGVPYFRAFTMPWTRTRAYPHAFAQPEHKMGGAYNYLSYVMFDNVFWKAIAGQVNRWRKKELKLARTGLDKMQPNKVPFLYNFSPSVVVPPLDYSDWIRVTGYWFLDEGKEYHPPKAMTEFIKKAKDDGKKLVYIGFGSIVVTDANALLRVVIESCRKADLRCILSKGWSDRLDQKILTPAPEIPEFIHQIVSAPHDWLFNQVDAVAHHGGAGTTGASLRAGKPTIIRPFFGDQYFFGGRVEDLGVGIYLRKMNVTLLSRALWEASNSVRMVTKAKVLGEQIRSENGVNTAIQCIYRDMEYAKSLIKRRPGEAANSDTEPAEDIEESWTFIGDDDMDNLGRVKSLDGGNGLMSAGLDGAGLDEVTERLMRKITEVEKEDEDDDKESPDRGIVMEEKRACYEV